MAQKRKNVNVKVLSRKMNSKSKESVKVIPPSNKTLDIAFGVVFIILSLGSLWAVSTRGLLWLFCIFLVATSFLIYLVQKLSEYVGLMIVYISNRLGFIDENPLSSSISMSKWKDQSWQLCVHVFSSSVGFYILSINPWWNDTVTCWLPVFLAWSDDGWLVLSSEKFAWDWTVQYHYLATLAIWIITCSLHVQIPVKFRHKDYYVAYLHHLVTIFLVTSSFSLELLRVGVLVMYVHDVSDIFVDLLKMANYIKLEGQKGFYLTEISYISCLLSWIYYRLYQFPVRVMKASLYDTYVHMDKLPPGKQSYLQGIMPDAMIIYLGLNVLLGILFIMHIYWFNILARIGFKIVFASPREASRDEYDGESEEEEE
jgi:TLC domain